MRASLIAVVAVGVLSLLPAGAAAQRVVNVMPHGQTEPGAPWLGTPGLLPADTQARMYDRLTPLYRDVTDAQLQPSGDGTGYFKNAAILPEDDPSFVSAETVSGTGPGGTALSARLKRDAYGVPFVFSDTDDGATFASGWVAASDRGLLIGQARTAGIAALADLPGASAIELILGLYQYRPSASLERRLEAEQTRAIRAQGGAGRQLLRDIDVYIAGANAFYAANAPQTKRLRRIDIYAANGVKAQFLGEGGGSELANAELLDRLTRQLGRRRGDAAWSDLRAMNDPEASVTTTRRATYQPFPGPARARGQVRLRAGTFRSSVPALPGSEANAAAASHAARQVTSTQHLASNVLIATGRRSSTGAPLYTGGPQIGYNYPGLTMETQIVSPSKRVRGITSPPFPGYMLIGSGSDFTWMLTSAGGDLIDVYAERLCGGSRTRYVYRGRCRRMQTVDAGTITKGDETKRYRFPQTVHGPVLGYARTRGGRTVALAIKRASRGRETTDLLFNQDLTYGRVTSARSFIRAAGKSPQTFNAMYASGTEAALFTTGRLPLRPRGVSPDLPVDGRGRFEWRGTLAKSRHPQDVNPASGYLVNWNNKPAAGWPASDERFGSEGGVTRNELLEGELARTETHTLASVVAAQNAGATQDVRGGPFFPTLEAMLARTPAPSPGAQQVLDVLRDWHSRGATRVDADGDGLSDEPGVTAMDTAWDGLADAAMCGRLGRRGCDALAIRRGRYDTPPGGQAGGWHQYMDKDFRTLLGQRVRGRYALRYCGRGDVRRCSTGLWRALETAHGRLVARYGADPAGWRQPAAKISFGPLPLTDIQYTNRPSGIHTVATFKP